MFLRFTAVALLSLATVLVAFEVRGHARTEEEAVLLGRVHAAGVTVEAEVVLLDAQGREVRPPALSLPYRDFRFGWLEPGIYELRVERNDETLRVVEAVVRPGENRVDIEVPAPMPRPATIVHFVTENDELIAAEFFWKHVDDSARYFGRRKRMGNVFWVGAPEAVWNHPDASKPLAWDLEIHQRGVCLRRQRVTLGRQDAWICRIPGGAKLSNRRFNNFDLAKLPRLAERRLYALVLPPPLSREVQVRLQLTTLPIGTYAELRPSRRDSSSIIDFGDFHGLEIQGERDLIRYSISPSINIGFWEPSWIAKSAPYRARIRVPHIPQGRYAITGISTHRQVFDHHSDTTVEPVEACTFTGLVVEFHDDPILSAAGLQSGDRIERFNDEAFQLEDVKLAYWGFLGWMDQSSISITVRRQDEVLHFDIDPVILCRAERLWLHAFP